MVTGEREKSVRLRAGGRMKSAAPHGSCGATANEATPIRPAAAPLEVHALPTSCCRFPPSGASSGGSSAAATVLGRPSRHRGLRGRSPRNRCLVTTSPGGVRCLGKEPPTTVAVRSSGDSRLPTRGCTAAGRVVGQGRCREPRAVAGSIRSGRGSATPTLEVGTAGPRTYRPGACGGESRGAGYRARWTPISRCCSGWTGPEVPPGRSTPASWSDRRPPARPLRVGHRRRRRPRRA